MDDHQIVAPHITFKSETDLAAICRDSEKWTPLNPDEWIISALENGKFIIAVGDGFGDYILSSSEWRELRRIILDRDDYVCQYCGGAANSVDHVFPKLQGGLTVEANLVAACRPCNSRKGGRL